MNKTKLQTSRIARRILAASALIVCFGFTLVSARADADKFLLISFDENFTSDTTIDGTEALAGAFSDKGTRHYNFTVQVNGNEAVVSGTIVQTLTQGTITEQFTGVIPRLDTNPTLITGTGFLTSGTGAYAGIRGSGTFEATIDFETGNIVGVTELKVKD